MKKVSLYFIAAVILICIHAQAQWQTATGPAGVGIQCLAIDPLDSNSVYAGGRLLFHSSDAGKTFSLVSGLPEESYSQYLTSIAISRDKDGPIILHSGGNSFVISRDRGKTWERIKQVEGIQPDSFIYAGPANSNTFYAGGYSSVMRSDDNGKTWQKCGLPPDINAVEHFVADRFDAKTMSFMYRKGDEKTFFFLSRDGGKSFKMVDFPKGEDFIASVSTDPKDARLIFVCTQRDGWARGRERRFFFTYDNGKTWESYWNPITEANPSEAIETKLRQIFPDMIASPLPVWGGMIINRSELAWSEDKAGFAVAQWMGRPFRSQDFGKTWVEMNDGLVASGIESIALDPIDAKAAYCSGGCFLWRTTDRCKTWKRMPIEEYFPVTIIKYISIVILRTGDQVFPELSSLDYVRIFAITNCIWKSQSRGKNWEKVWKSDDYRDRPVGMFVKEGETGKEKSLVVVCSNFLLESTDGGENWKVSGKHNLVLSPNPSHIASSQVKSGEKDVWYLQISYNELMKSIDYGVTWEKVESNHITAWSAGADGSLWMLKQNQLEIQGENTQKSDIPRTTTDGKYVSPASLVCDLKDADTAYIGLRNGRIVRTTDHGKTFMILDGGPSPVSFQYMAISTIDGALWVGTYGNGVWILDNPKTYNAIELK